MAWTSPRPRRPANKLQIKVVLFWRHGALRRFSVGCGVCFLGLLILTHQISTALAIGNKRGALNDSGMELGELKQIPQVEEGTAGISTCVVIQNSQSS